LTKTTLSQWIVGIRVEHDDGKAEKVSPISIAEYSIIIPDVSLSKLQTYRTCQHVSLSRQSSSMYASGMLTCQTSARYIAPPSP
jgi:hypothetical protein